LEPRRSCYSRLQIDGSFLKKRTQESLFTCGARHFGSNWKWRETPTNSGLKGAGTRGCRHDPTVHKISMLLAHSPPPPSCKCGQLAARYCPSGFFAEIAADVPPGQRLFFCFRLVPAIDMQGNAPHSAVIVLRTVEHELAIKAGQRVRPFATTMPSKRPPHMSPEEWREYLRRWPRMSWWLRDVDGNHPDYPEMPQNSESTDDSPPHDRTPSPPQQSFLASLTSRSHLPPLSPLPFSQWARQQRSLRASESTSPRDTPTGLSQCTSRPWSQLNAGPTASQASPPPSQCTYTRVLRCPILILVHSELSEQQQFCAEPLSDDNGVSSVEHHDRQGSCHPTGVANPVGPHLRRLFLEGLRKHGHQARRGYDWIQVPQ
jgi:hypothetical protein